MNAPLSVAALPDSEVAVATLREPHLVTVFDKNGREIREFGELEDISDRADLNRYLNSGYLASDDSRRYFYTASSLSPEPTVRSLDRNGYAMQTIQFTEIEAFASAQAARKEIERQERKGKQPAFRPILTAIGVAPTGEVWIALHSRLLRFDKDGNRQATYQLYTPEGARLDANTILIEKDRILIASDPQGVFEFDRPDTKLTQ